jgi:hypothetical protein
MPATEVPYTAGHTERDWRELVDAGANPWSTAPREHAVGCIACRKPTFHQMGGCDSHYTPPAAAVRARQAVHA